MAAGIPMRDRKEEEKKRKKRKKRCERERERERGWMVANGITGTVRYAVLLAFPQTVVHTCSQSHPLLNRT